MKKLDDEDKKTLMAVAGPNAGPTGTPIAHAKRGKHLGRNFNPSNSGATKSRL